MSKIKTPCPSKEIRKPTLGNVDPVLVSHAFLNTMADKVAKLGTENDALKSLEKACVEFYCGMITMGDWRKAVRASPEGQRLIALAQESPEKQFANSLSKRTGPLTDDEKRKALAEYFCGSQEPDNA